jgi:hypothetical protein
MRCFCQNAHHIRARGQNLNTNEQLIEAFYLAFQDRDPSAMAACYTSSIHFSDPVFVDLHGSEVEAMWDMLLAQGKDLEIVFSDIHANNETGSAHWDATYTLGATGRVVHNSIDARFEFSDGKIVRHIDNFDLWKWSRMALGLVGTLTGWAGPAKSKIRSTAGRGLARFIDSHPQYQAGEGS